MRMWPRARARPQLQPALRPSHCAMPPPCAPAATPAAHLGAHRVTSLDLSYFCVQVPLPLLMDLPCPRSEETYARCGIAVGAAVAAATSRGVRSSRVEPGLVLELAVAQPHWQATAQAHDQCMCVCGLELELGHSQPSGPGPVRCRPCAPLLQHQPRTWGRVESSPDP